MRVLAIDPGYDRLGVAIMEHGGSKEKLIHSDCLQTNKKETVGERLFQLGEKFSALIEEYHPEAVAIEKLFFNKNQKTALSVAEARGMLLYLALKNKCQVIEFSPQEIKVAVTGYGKSDKVAVTDMVKRLVPEAPDKALDDEYDAIAVGITTLAHHKE